MKTLNVKPEFHWKNILVPVDLSDASRHSLKIAAGLAEEFGGALTLLHIVHTPVCFTDAPIDAEDLMGSAADSLDRLAKEIPAALIRQKLVEFCKQGISQDVVEAAYDIRADLIVITTHGYHGLKRVLHGHLAEAIAGHAPCPVLIVPPDENPSMESPIDVRKPETSF